MQRSRMPDFATLWSRKAFAQQQSALREVYTLCARFQVTRTFSSFHCSIKAAEDHFMVVVVHARVVNSVMRKITYVYIEKIRK